MMLSLRRAATLGSRRNSCSFSTLKDNYEYVKVEKRDGGVGLLTLNRPKALNALCDALFEDLIHAGRALDEDMDIGCMVLTGSPKAFAAGADIAEMSTKTFEETYSQVRMRLVVFDGVEYCKTSLTLTACMYQISFPYYSSRICLLNGQNSLNSPSQSLAPLMAFVWVAVANWP